MDRVIRAFYAKLRVHPELNRFFVHIEHFERHERHIADFWWIAMGGRLPARPSFDMVARHRPLGLDARAFAQWLTVFEETLHEELPAELARAWQQMALGIGRNLQKILLHR